MENTTTITPPPPPPTTSNHDNNAKIFASSSKTREEGELSASENDEFAGSQFRDSTTLPRVSLNKNANIVIGKSVMTHNSTHPGVASKASVHTNNRKGTEKNRVPFVISFSDDDSGSDSEDYRQGNTIESDDMTRGVVEKKSLPISSGNPQPPMIQKTANTNTKIPKKLSMSRTFLPSRNSGSTFVGVKSHIKKSNPPSKNKTGPTPNVHINSSKLQDLRQLIALREIELKSRAEKHDKETVSSSLKNNGNMNSKSPTEPKEPEKKRLKVSDPPTNTIAQIDNRPPTAESTLAAPESDKEIVVATGRSSAMHQTKKVRNHNIPLNLPSGTGIIRNSRRHNRNTNLVEFTAPLAVKTAKRSPHKQGRTNTSNIWDHSGTGDMDMKSLLEIEEQQDKELDEAQEHRRKCEIEERNALKAYRKAQRALAEANTRCSYLYHKRELFSANLRSHVMEDSTMFWSNHQDLNLRSTTNEDGKRLGSDSCGEPDTNTSTSEPHEDNNNDNDDDNDNALGEDEQTSAFELKEAGESSFDSHGESERTKVTLDPTEDSLLLEATLRSQLFARLGNRISKKTESGQSMEPIAEREDGEIMEASGNIQFSEMEKDQVYDSGEKSTSEHMMDMNDQCEIVNYGCLGEPVLKSAFGHVNFTSTKTPQIHTNEKKIDGICTDLLPTSVWDTTEVGSYSNKLRIDPSWPLCMFELRGKCNNDACPYQHLKDNSDSNTNDNASQKKNGATTITIPKCHVAPPTYLVSLDSLKSDSHPYKYLVAQTVEQKWQKYFSASMVVSASFLADEPRIEVHGGWNRQSSYFHSQNLKEGIQDLEDTDQSLEIALLKLSREVNKQKGRREALIVLARALEEHPTSVLIWIVYLHIYYSNQKSIGKDDLFCYAIDHNDSSYELWLMFINSREKIDERLLAYNSAISALCRHASESRFILDLFLQMVNCLISSGQVQTAIQKVYEFIPSTNLSLPDIHTHLTTSDKSTLWICSVYLLMYKKLPDKIVQQFECPKDPSKIQWDSDLVRLTPDEKQQAVTLIELASESFKSEDFAVNHVRCVVVLQGLEFAKNLVKKYLRLHPSSLELVLLSIRVNESDSAFEEALTKWAGQPGVHCIWNQYAQYALENGRFDFAKEVMNRWVVQTGSTRTENVFGLLNLSLYKQFQNEETEARVAIEQALDVASFEDYYHCVKEHGVFSFKNGSNLVELLKLLNRYITDPRGMTRPEPLSRTFIKTITNPKLQKLVNNLLTPISSDFSLMNVVLEVCFGESLERLEDFVDFVEGLMEMRPGNYELALSICKISGSGSGSASVCFWAGSMLMNCLFQAVPVAAESVWVEAGGVLGKMDLKSGLENFYEKALSVYPYSVRLWKLYLGLYGGGSDEANGVIEMAREKGLELTLS